jgi:hypothetical protein
LRDMFTYMLMPLVYLLVFCFLFFSVHIYSHPKIRGRERVRLLYLIAAGSSLIECWGLGKFLHLFRCFNTLCCECSTSYEYARELSQTDSDC